MSDKARPGLNPARQKPGGVFLCPDPGSGVFVTGRRR